MMKICYYKTKSVETLAAWGCCLNSEKGPTWIGKLSPHSAGSGVLKTGSVNVIVTTPASSVFKIPLGGRSAVECGLSIWFLSSSRLVQSLWVGSEAMRFWCKQSGNLHVVGNRSKLASLLLGLGLGGTFCEEVGAAVWELDLVCGVFGGRWTGCQYPIYSLSKTAFCGTNHHIAPRSIKGNTLLVHIYLKYA